MRLISYLQAGDVRLGAVDGADVLDLNRAWADLAHTRGAISPVAEADATLPADVVAFLRGGAATRSAADAAVAHVQTLDADKARAKGLRVAAADVDRLPPVPRPTKIICVARNYAEHAKEAGLELPTLPILFTRFAATLLADGEPILRPKVSEQLDWEGELAIVIGKAGAHITRENAMEHIAGYSIFNDVTVRDYQFRVTQYTAGKNFRASGPFGPELVLADEVSDPHALEIVTTLSGEEMQRASTADMIFDLPTLIEHISEFIDLEPGDVIATGTPAGVGFKRTPPRFLVPGDVVNVSISGLGELENPVVAEEDR